MENPSNVLLRLVVACWLVAVVVARCGMDPATAKSLQWPKRNVLTWEYGLSQDVTDFNWEEKVHQFQDTPVFIQFFTPWDKISQMIASEWTTLANDVNTPDSNHSFIVAHVNSWENSDVTDLFNVHSWPTLKVMHGDYMYTYNTSGRQSQQMFRDFGNGGFNNVHWRRIGGSPLDPFLDARDEAEVIFRDVFGTAAPMVGCGALGGLFLGLLVARIVLGSSGHDSQKSKLLEKKLK